MSSATDTHPLVIALRREFEIDDELTQAQAAEQIGVSTRTVQYWLASDTTPQKRHRPMLREWLAGRAA